MKNNNNYNFTLVLLNVFKDTEGLEDVLFDAGCNDALLYFRKNFVFLEFDRDANNLKEAIFSAMKEVETADIPIKVAKIQPDDLVSASEIARRLNKSRESVRKLIISNSSLDFPTPAVSLNKRSQLWSWYKVSLWLFKSKKLIQRDIIDNAKLIYEINSVLDIRENNDLEYKLSLLHELKGLNIDRSILLEA
jgi:hypothetical protein